MGTKSLTVEISEALYDRLYRVAPKYRGRHESDKRRKEPYAHFIDDSVEIALTEYLDRIEKQAASVRHR